MKKKFVIAAFWTLCPFLIKAELAKDGWHRLQSPFAAPENHGIQSKGLATPLSLLSVGDPITGITPPSASPFIELAQSLEYKPARVFAHIRNHFDFTPYYGYLKGPHLTLRDKSGNDCDLAKLTLMLMQQCPDVTSATLVKGSAKVSSADLQAWLKVDDEASALSRLTWAFIHHTINGSEVTLTEHYWVRIVVDGVTYDLDPSFKKYQKHLGLSPATLAGLMNYSQNTMLDELGGTLTTGVNPYYQISATASTAAGKIKDLKTHLDDRITDLVTAVQTNHANTEIKDFIGGYSIIHDPYATAVLSAEPTAITLDDEDGGEITHFAASLGHKIAFTHGTTAKWCYTHEVGARSMSFSYVTDGNTPAEPPTQALSDLKFSWTVPSGIPVKNYNTWYFGKLPPYALPPSTTLYGTLVLPNFSPTYSLYYRTYVLPHNNRPTSGFTMSGSHMGIVSSSDSTSFQCRFNPVGLAAGIYECMWKVPNSTTGYPSSSSDGGIHAFGDATITKGHLVTGSKGATVTTRAGEPYEFSCYLVNSGAPGDPVPSISAASIVDDPTEAGSDAGVFQLLSSTDGEYKIKVTAFSAGVYGALCRIPMVRDDVSYTIDLPIRATVESAARATLKLNGTPIFTETTPGIAGSSPATLKITLLHPYKNINGDDYTGADQEGTYSLKRHGKYVIGMDFGGASSGNWQKQAVKNLTTLLNSGVAADSEDAIASTLEVLASAYFQQITQTSDIVQQFTGVHEQTHHGVGIVAQEESFYIDVRHYMLGYTSRTTASANEMLAFSLRSALLSSLEHGIIEQYQPGVTAVSTERLLERALASGQRVYRLDQDSTTAGWNALTGYSAETKSDFQIRATDGNATVIIPQNGSIQSLPGNTSSWKGYGVLAYTSDNFLMAIGGGYLGGYAALQEKLLADIAQTIGNILREIPATTVQIPSKEPVDLVSGFYLYDHDDLSFGTSGTEGINLHRSYNSGNILSNSAGLGWGWDHNWNSMLSFVSDSDMAWGKRHAIDAAPALVAITALMDLNLNPSVGQSAKGWCAQAIISNWCVDKIRYNAAKLKTNGMTLVFSNLYESTTPTAPAGPFYAPPSSSHELTKTGTAEYTLSERLGGYYVFTSSAGAYRLKYVRDHENLVTRDLTLTYVTTGKAAGLVNLISDDYGRSLDFVYNTSGQLTSVKTAGSQDIRTVFYGYDTDKNLTTYTDEEGQVFTFGYTPVGPPTDPNFDPTFGATPPPHCIYQLKDATDRVIANNFYNSSGQTVEQRAYGLETQKWFFHFVDEQTIQTNPAGGRDILYFDRYKRQIGGRDANGLLTSKVYDAQNHLVQMINPAGETTSFTYDTGRFAGNGPFKFHHLRSAAYPDNTTEGWEYDALHRLTQQVDRRGVKTTMVYSSDKNRPDYVRLYSDATHYAQTAFLYYTGPAPSAGKVQQTTDAAGGVTTFTYGTHGRPATTGRTVEVMSGTAVAPQATTKTAAYTARGDLDYTIDARGIRTSYAYNKRRQQTQMTANSTGPVDAQSTVNWTYDNNGQLASVHDPLGYLERYTYSAQNKPLKTFTVDQLGTPGLGDDPYSETLYDSRDWPTHFKSLSSRETVTDYYANGWKKSVTAPGNRTAHFHYHPRGEIETTVAGGYAMRTERNLTTRTTTNSAPYVVTDPENPSDPLLTTKSIIRTHDEAGNPTSITNYAGNSFQLQYNHRGQQRHLYTPLLKHQETVYDDAGRPDSVISPSTKTVNSTYYPLSGWLASLTDSLGQVQYRYDANGNTRLVTDGTLSLERTYDALNRLDTVTDHRGYTVDYDHHSNGNLAAIKYPRMVEGEASKQVRYEYHKNRLLKSVRDWSGRVTLFGWDVEGRLTSVTRPNGTQRIISYTTTGEIERITEKKKGGGVIAFYQFGYDDRGLVNKRVAVPQHPGRTSPATLAAAVNADNQLVTANAVTIVHDDDGNMTTGPRVSDGASASYLYDARNRLTSHDVATHIAYDVEGRRTAITESSETTEFALSPGESLYQVLVEKREGGSRRYYVYALGMLLYEVSENESVRYYHYDQVGSTVALTGADGVSITGSLQYGPWGEEIFTQGDIDTRYRFCGAYGVQTDKNGLIHMRARYYQPNLGRFINQDPIGFAGGMNWYSYANGDPILNNDPRGLEVFAAARDLNGVFVGTHQFIIMIPHPNTNIVPYQMQDLGNGTQGLVIGAHNTGRLQVKFFEDADFQATREHFNPTKYSKGWSDYDTEVRIASKPSGISQTQYENDILGKISNYQHNESYSNIPYPAMGFWGGHGVNSNSWVQSVIEYANGTVDGDFTGADALNAERVDEWYFKSPPVMTRYSGGSGK